MGDFRLVAEYSFQAWLTTIAKRNLADALRMMAADKRGGRHPHTRQGRDQSFDTLLTQIHCGGNTPSREVSAEEIRRTLADALEQLPEPHRTVVWQYDIEGQAVSDIAVALQRSAGAIYMLRARAHRWLADQLGRPSDFFSDFA
jgi:RNA polymerase sigma factor (sigma-70 family)